MGARSRRHSIPVRRLKTAAPRVLVDERDHAPLAILIIWTPPIPATLDSAYDVRLAGWRVTDEL
jgi:hypothetical protein